VWRNLVLHVSRDCKLLRRRPDLQAGKKAGDSMIDFGGGGAEASPENASLNQARAADEEQEGEPEERKASHPDVKICLMLKSA